MNTMKLYTFVMEYRGGTYVSQIYAEDRVKAKDEWISHLDYKQIRWLGLKSKTKLESEIKNENPVALDGLKNVWCLVAWLYGYMVLINFIETSNSSTPRPRRVSPPRPAARLRDVQAPKLPGLLG
jgi:hypothetical protein